MIHTRKPRSFLTLLGAAGVLAGCRTSPASTRSVPDVDPALAVNELIATDRAFADSAQRTDLVTALSAMFAENVVMGGTTHLHGKAAAIAALRGNPENPTSKVAWTLIRAGISSDGLHGFTQGYVTTTRSSGTQLPGKYLGYWIKGPEGWRLAVYKRMGRPAGEVALALLDPSLPQRGLPSGERAQLRRYEQELKGAEAAFSGDATLIGLRPAFLKWGAPDALNVGGSAEWARGNVAISQSAGLSGGPPGGIVWSSSEVIVAATGDLGVSIGYITPASGGLPAGGQGQPFFTIWKRANPGAPWQYVAE